MELAQSSKHLSCFVCKPEPSSYKLAKSGLPSRTLRDYAQNEPDSLSMQSHHHPITMAGSRKAKELTSHPLAFLALLIVSLPLLCLQTSSLVLVLLLTVLNWLSFRLYNDIKCVRMLQCTRLESQVADMSRAAVCRACRASLQGTALFRILPACVIAAGKGEISVVPLSGGRSRYR